MKYLLTLIITLGLPAVATAADIQAGKAKSASCAACHGPQGISNNPEWPNLAGQKDRYLEKQMIAFRDGKRKDPLMTPMVKHLSDQDIKNIAAYFASLKP
ncbi:c-type cytochrome [Porticoccus sp. GXU_MW_L64]